MILVLCLSLLFAGEIPRPEFPQPQFERDEWLNLNGRWDFEFDDQNRGLSERWEAQRKFTRTILVPFAFEGAKSGIGQAAVFHPVVWYRRGFKVPAGWKARRVLLRFGAVDYRATVWLNGQLLGRHQGGHTPFCFEITSVLQSPDNTLVVRAEDPPTDKSIPRGKQSTDLASFGMYYTRTTGIWQTVWLEAVGSSWLEKARITPAATGQVQFDLDVSNSAPGLTVRVQVTREGRPVTAASAPAEQRRVSTSAQVEAPQLWSLKAPNLYDVTFELARGGEVLDRVKSYFGFRSVAAANGRVLINNRPSYLKMVVDQGYWPESTITPPSDEAIKYDIRMTKEMGFNGARKHQKIEDPRYLYWADRLGLFVSGEMPSAFRFGEESVSRIQREWIAAIERDYNHPCIIMWTPINENWGVGNLRDPRGIAYLKSIYWTTRTFDSTRLVVDNDGYLHTDSTDLFTLHSYGRTGDLIIARYKDLGKPGSPIPAGENQRGRELPPPLAPGFTYNGSPFILSEFGTVAYAMPGHPIRDTVWGGRERVEKTPESALARLRSMYEALAKIPAFAGICYMQLTDTEDELNGLLAADRRPKYESKYLRELNDMLK